MPADLTDQQPPHLARNAHSHGLIEILVTVLLVLRHITETSQRRREWVMDRREVILLPQM